MFSDIRSTAQNVSIVLALAGLLFFGVPASGLAQEVSTSVVAKRSTVVHIFERDDCTYCRAEKRFLEQLESEGTLPFVIEWHDVVNNKDDNTLYQTITALKQVPRITPITIVGDTLIQGFDAPETTGERIIAAIKRDQERDAGLTLQDFLSERETAVAGDAAAGCDSGDVCRPEDPHAYTFKLPILGVVDLQSFSLLTLSVVLGTVDGFNPCAMWVLITFLLVLLQVGDRRRMWQIAGLFILAEAVMYGLILNVWYSTWDFVGLDAIVTPLIGLLAIGSGVYFLYKYHKSRKALVCDVVDVQTQGKIQQKITAIAKAPLTLAAIGGVLMIAFSVNVIEFACSVGIPQAFTKILELNQLSFLQTQGYTLVYILFYMIDDFIVFALALWGFNKIHAAEKYSRISMLVGGVLMILLGALLLFAPHWLTF